MTIRLNNIQIMGYLGADPEMRYTQGGDAVTSFRVAVDDSYKNKDTGEKVERTDWFKVVAWRGLAEMINQYCSKGTAVYVQGKGHERKWQDQEGNDRYTFEITADNFEIIKQPAGAQDVAPAQDRAPAKPASSARQPAKPAATRAPARNVPQTIDSDEDLPF